MTFKDSLQAPIPPRATSCFYCKISFLPPAEILSFFKKLKEEALREDYCIQCAEKVESEKKKRGF